MLKNVKNKLYPGHIFFHDLILYFFLTRSVYPYILQIFYLFQETHAN